MIIASYNCYVSTWSVIYNSLDIDFSQGDIHGRSGEKIRQVELFGTPTSHGWRFSNCLARKQIVDSVD